MPRTKEEQKAHLAKIRAKAETVGERHGTSIQALRLTILQSLQTAGVMTWSYVRKSATNA